MDVEEIFEETIRYDGDMAIFEAHCEDIHGNKYEEYSQTSSCCECLRRVFFFIKKTLNITLHFQPPEGKP